MKKFLLVLPFILCAFAGYVNATSVNYESLKTMNSLLYEVVKENEKEMGRPYRSIEEIQRDSSTNEFQAKLKSKQEQFCVLPENSNNLMCIRHGDGVGTKS